MSGAERVEFEDDRLTVHILLLFLTGQASDQGTNTSI
jgi:hypothetical protein